MTSKGKPTKNKDQVRESAGKTKREGERKRGRGGRDERAYLTALNVPSLTNARSIVLT